MEGLLLSLQLATTVLTAGVSDRFISLRGRVAHTALEHAFLPGSRHHNLIFLPVRAIGLQFFFPLTATHTRR